MDDPRRAGPQPGGGSGTPGASGAPFKIPPPNFWLNEITHEAGFLLDLVPADRPIVGAEVGTLIAKSATILLRRRPQLRLYLIDSWESRPPAEAIAVQHLRSAGVAPRAMILKGDSTAMAACLDDGALDFAFIDASKSPGKYEADVLAWLPKVKRGGFISGHDLSWDGIEAVVHRHFGTGYERNAKRDAWWVRL